MKCFLLGIVFSIAIISCGTNDDKSEAVDGNAIGEKCSTTEDCVEGSYCKKEMGKCSEDEGLCEDIEVGDCDAIWMPVCGCDGKTYGNSCSIDVSGVNIDYEGECK